LVPRTWKFWIDHPEYFMSQPSSSITTRSKRKLDQDTVLYKSDDPEKLIRTIKHPSKGIFGTLQSYIRTSIGRTFYKGTSEPQPVPSAPPVDLLPKSPKVIRTRESSSSSDSYSSPNTSFIAPPHPTFEFPKGFVRQIPVENPFQFGKQIPESFTPQPSAPKLDEILVPRNPNFSAQSKNPFTAPQQYLGQKQIPPKTIKITARQVVVPEQPPQSKVRIFGSASNPSFAFHTVKMPTTGTSADPAATYVSVYMHPDNFYDGKTSVKSFLEKYEAIAVANNWTDKQKLQNFVLHISGAVKDFYKAYQTKNASFSWTDLKDAVLAAFQSKTTKEEFERKLRERRMVRNETVEDYYWNMDRLFQKVDPKMTDDRKISYLIRGIHPVVAREVYAKEPKKPEDVLAALRSIEKFNSIMGRTKQAIHFVEHEEEANEIAEAVINKLEHFRVSSAGTTNSQGNQPVTGQTGMGKASNQKKNKKFKKYAQHPPKQQNTQPIHIHVGKNPHRQYKGQKGSNNNYGRNRNTFNNEGSFAAYGDLTKYTDKDGKPVCAYCRRPGHFIYECRSRQGN
jgi:Retrotransposon gag protein